ncbi:hypothetical protein B0J14DRAFT_563766 [Halenospora varia]|nr:hypothetical protein B0J14DRAFT_563766 [Halenospora varia]
MVKVASGSAIPQRFLPKHYFKVLLLAMVFVFKVKVVYPEEVKSRQDQVHTHIRLVYQLLCSWSQETLDEPGRAVRLIDVILRAENQSLLELNQSSSEGRPGVTLLNDIISTAREIRESESLTQSKSHQFLNETLNSQEFEQSAGLKNPSGQFDGPGDSLLDWNFPWGLDLLSKEQYNLEIVDVYNNFV